MYFRQASSPHNRGTANTSQLMTRVLLALLPGVLASCWFFGWGVAVNLLLACSTALLTEAAVMALRKRPVLNTLRDNSALVTAILLALSIPPLMPWWMPVLGTLFAILIAKHLYGGLGFNPFNPAMVAYVVLLISFPLEMSQWPAAIDAATPALNLSSTALFVFFGALPEAIGLDGLTMATALDYSKTQLRLGQTMAEVSASPVVGFFGTRHWEWVSLMYLLGGLWLLYKKVINWHIPVALLGSLALISAIFFLIDSDQFGSPLFHLLSGGVMLGAFFIATDPVTASASNVGRLVYAAGIGLLIYIIRTWGGYPDGIAFAVLLMNLAAPTIDHFYQPRAFGHR